MDSKPLGRKGRLRVVTSFTTPDGDSYEEKHAGYCSVVDGAAGERRLLWEETREGQHDDIELTLRGAEAEMVRRGETCGRLRFSPGRRLDGEYTTPYGALDMAVESRGLEWSEADGRGELLLEYDLYVNGALSNSARMQLQWRL